jgi:membrane fusion protein (multidrug efflux system)
MRVLLALLLVAALAPSARAQTSGAVDDGVVAPVVTIPAAERDLQAVIAGFGKVEPDANGVLAVSVPHNGIVSRVYVHAGQAVIAGAPLLDLAPTPSAHLAYEQARTALELARADLTRTQRLFAEQLATRDQIDKAKSVLRDAEATLQAQTQSGAGRAIEKLTAAFGGTVIAVAASEGEQLQEGAKALVLARSDALMVRLGVEPEEAKRLRAGMDVSLADALAQAKYPGRLTAVDAVINQQTRLVDALAQIDAAGGDAPLIGAVMRGEITLAREHRLALPRGAVLADREGTYVFVVRDGKAQRVAVTTGIDDGRWVAVTGGVQPGDSVVIQGNYELQDGMTVQSVAGNAR